MNLVIYFQKKNCDHNECGLSKGSLILWCTNYLIGPSDVPLDVILKIIRRNY